VNPLTNVIAMDYEFILCSTGTLALVIRGEVPRRLSLSFLQLLGTSFSTHPWEEEKEARYHCHVVNLKFINLPFHIY